MIYWALFYARSSWLLRYSSKIKMRKFPRLVIYFLWCNDVASSSFLSRSCCSTSSIILIGDIFRIFRDVFVPFKCVISFSGPVALTSNWEPQIAWRIGTWVQSMVLLLHAVDRYAWFLFWTLCWFVKRILSRFGQMLPNVWSVRVFSWWLWIFRNHRWLVRWFSPSVLFNNNWIWFTYIEFILVSLCTLIFFYDNLRETPGVWKFILSILSLLSSETRSFKLLIRLIEFTKVIFDIDFFSVSLIHLIITLWIPLARNTGILTTLKCLMISCGIEPTGLKRWKRSRWLVALIAQSFHSVLILLQERLDVFLTHFILKSFW